MRKKGVVGVYINGRVRVLRGGLSSGELIGLLGTVVHMSPSYIWVLVDGYRIDELYNGVFLFEHGEVEPAGEEGNP